MQRVFWLLPAFVLILASAFVPGTLMAASPSQETSTAAEMDIVETAIAAGDFTTLVAAVQAADLVETLQGDGPFTVFAPTDAAFAALPEGTVESLLEDPAGALQDILLYHVLPGEVKAVDVLNSIGAAVEMANGQPAQLTVDGNRVLLANAGFVATDIQTSNGIIHVIDAVMLPPAADAPADEPTSDPAPEEAAPEELTAVSPVEPSPATMNIVDTAVAAGDFATLVAAVQAAGLVETLQGEGPFTVFAPTDAAFAALPAGAVDALLQDPTGALTNVLLYHVLPGAVAAADVVALDNSAVTTANGDYVVVRVADGVVKINDATVTVTDIETSNGIIHVIDAVLIPPTKDVVEPQPAAPSGCSVAHHVRRGETLSSIARHYGVNTHALADANNIHNPNRIYVGQRICISH